MKILMVCLGNICRSPMAEGILRSKLVREGIDAEVQSAGTSSWHAGENPDRRAIAKTKSYGVDISKQVAQQFTSKHFEVFDYIFVMDEENHRNVMSLVKNEEHKSKVDFLLNKSYLKSNMNVPDPYFGGEDGFEHVYNLIDQACEVIVEELIKKSK
ncbi:MAG: low molecular weight protein-tyrosine-phosphatase [Bacteroidia bacterium]